MASIDALERAGVPYVVVGSLASSLYGIPRSTRDADFVIQLAGESLASIMRELGDRFVMEPQGSFETVTATTRNVINVKDGLFQIELFHLSDDPHDRLRFQRRQRVPMFSRETYALTAEDVVITKLRWSRQGQRLKDVDDVRSVIAVQGDKLDWEYVRHWCDEHGTRELLEDLRSSVREI